MGMMNIQIYGREYPIACDDGQEAHLGKLAQLVNDRVRTLSQQMGRGPEHTMLIYTALMLADELSDAQREINRLNSIMAGNRKVVDESKMQEMERAMASSMQQIAQKIERLAIELEAA